MFVDRAAWQHELEGSDLDVGGGERWAEHVPFCGKADWSGWLGLEIDF